MLNIRRRRLNDIAEKARKMKGRSRLSRLVRSQKDVEELSDLERELSRATQDFKVSRAVVNICCLLLTVRVIRT